jgi:hypothetical protein
MAMTKKRFPWADLVLLAAVMSVLTYLAVMTYQGSVEYGVKITVWTVQVLAAFVCGSLFAATVSDWRRGL